MRRLSVLSIGRVAAFPDRLNVAGWRWLGLLLLLAAGVLTQPVYAQAYYTVTDLTPRIAALPCTTAATPSAINNNGVIVGSLGSCGSSGIAAQNNGYALNADPSIASTTFCTRPIDINDSNTVLGRSATIDSVAATLGPNYGCYSPYARFYQQFQAYEPVAVNSRGDAIANVGVANASLRAPTLLSGSRAISLGTIPGATATDAEDINDAGVIVGTAKNSACTAVPDCAYAVLYANGAWQDLRSRIGAVQSRAIAINNAGTVLGQAFPDIGSGSSRSVGWVLTGAGRVDIPALAQNYLTPIGLNNAGVVIASSGLSGQVPVVFWGGQSYDLNALLAPSPGMTILTPLDINDRGQIIAQARAADGSLRSVLTGPLCLVQV